MSDRCPYCSDYESIKEELEETKRNIEKETKSSLKNCEDERKKLKKQFVVIALIVVVAGTLLGKEFVDKVAGYIDSFNSVKEAGSDLISESSFAPSKPNIKTWPFVLKNSETSEPFKQAMPKLLNVQMYEADKLDTFTSNSNMLSVLTTPYSIDTSVVLDQTIDYLPTSWSDYLIYTRPEPLLPIDIDPFIFKDPLDIQFYNSPPIPGPSVLLSFAVGILFIKRRKR